MDLSLDQLSILFRDEPRDSRTIGLLIEIEDSLIIHLRTYDLDALTGSHFSASRLKASPMA